jgi:hypothetical protein
MAHEEARRHYLRALDLLAQSGSFDRRWFELCVRLVDAERLCGAHTEAHSVATRAMDWAREHGTAEDLASAACAYARACPETGTVDQPLMTTLEDVLARLPRRPSLSRVTLSGRLAVLLSFSQDGRRAVELSGQALDDAHALGDPAVIGRALASRIFCLIGFGDADARRLLGEALDEARSVSRVCKDPDVTLDLLGWSHLTMLNGGLVEQAREEAFRLEQLNHVAQRPLYTWYIKSTRAARALWEGDYAAAETLALDAVDYGRRTEMQPVDAYYGGQLFQICRDLGRMQQILPMLKAQATALPTAAIWRAGLCASHTATSRTSPGTFIGCPCSRCSPKSAHGSATSAPPRSSTHGFCRSVRGSSPAAPSRSCSACATTRSACSPCRSATPRGQPPTFATQWASLSASVRLHGRPAPTSA